MLVHRLMEGGHSVFVAKKARAVIDLNRSDNEIDPGMIANAPPHPGFFASAKVRGGLGLIPRRLSTYGDLWNGPFEWPDVKQSIMEYHQRSEEHTSELQSLMRSSYDVICLKKKTT